MRARGAGRRLLSVVWALAPLALALPAAPCFAWAAWRVRSRRLAIEAAAYGGATLCYFVAAGDEGGWGDAAGGLGLATMAVATGRAFMVRRRVFDLDEAKVSVPAVPPPAGWMPTFPGLEHPPMDRRDPATWIPAFSCTGTDRHEIGVPPLRLIGFALGGGALIVLHVATGSGSDRAIGTGVGMLLVPLFAVAFKQELDGPALRYRWWGVRRVVRLDTVGSVSLNAGRGGNATLVLRAATHRRSVRVAMSSPMHVAPATVRDHLRGWLERPGVDITPEAAAALRTDTTPAEPPRPSKARRALALVFTAVLPLTIVAVAWFASRDGGTHQPIPGAPGYVLYGGPHGKTIEVGQPWGSRCQPLTFAVAPEVPDWIYNEIDTVIAEARRGGINVTIETRNLQWFPASLYFPPGTRIEDVQRVILYYDDTARRSPDGRRDALEMGWNAELTDDGDHEYVTLVQGVLHGPAMDDPFKARRAARQLLALTQGIIESDRTDSGIRTDTQIDRLTPTDLAAMRLMSGCNNAAAAVVAPGPTS